MKLSLPRLLQTLVDLDPFELKLNLEVTGGEDSELLKLEFPRIC